ncbi:MAG: glycosyltransferase family 8 protein [Clostridia bacterium]|nr:glycosyltransferase family 8 protein [Clostridia bacterium]
MNTTNKKIIPIFFATDDNYAPFLVVTLESIFANASKDYQYNIHVLTNGLNDDSIAKIDKYKNENVVIDYVNMHDKMEEMGNALHTRDYYSKATYFRLFAPKMFPEYDKALYLDCDIIVRGDISDLYNYDIKNNLVGAVPDEAVANVPEFIAYTDNFLDVESKRYFNAGILIMNMKELRNINFESRFINLLTAYTFNVAQDQDYLNVICKDRVYYLPKTWNKMPIPDSKLKLENLNLIHYNLSYKPWHFDGILYENEFWKYAYATNVIDDILLHKLNYTSDKQERDLECGKRLIVMAYEQSLMEDSFKNLVTNGKMNLEEIFSKGNDFINNCDIIQEKKLNGWL